MTVKEMDAVIQEYCNKHIDRSGGDCGTCKIYDLCGEVSGDFETNPAHCKEACEVIVSLHKPNPNANLADDPVNHPSHYTKGKIEVADFIVDQKLNFDRGNAVKYVCRAGSKDPSKEIQDLEKAIWYINHEIKTLKGEMENAAEKENAR